MKAAIYARVSTDAQEDRGSSLTTQVEGCTETAKARGYEVPQDFIITESFTGSELNRPGLDRVRQLAKDKEAQAVFCHDPDRLSRDFVHLMILANEFEKAGCNLQFVTQQVGKTPEDRMLFGMKGLFAEYEREVIKQRTVRGKQKRIAEGRLVYGCNLFGFDYADGKRTIKDTEAKWIRKMFDWYVKGFLSLYQIANKLADSGVRTPRGNKTWRGCTVRSMLSNPAYIGTIVSEDLFNTAQGRFKRNSDLASRNKRHEFLLSGYLFCTRCGMRYNGISPSVGGKTYLYYQCAHNVSTEPNRCHNPNKNASVMDAIIWGKVAESCSQPDKLISLVERFNKRPAESGSITELEDTKKRLDDLDKSQTRLLDEAIRGFPDKLVESENKKINETRARLEKRKVELEQRIKRAKRDQIVIDDIDRHCKVFRCCLTHRPSLKQKREILERLNFKAYLDGDKLYLTGDLLLPEDKITSDAELCRLGLVNQY